MCVECGNVGRRVPLYPRNYNSEVLLVVMGISFVLILFGCAVFSVVLLVVMGISFVYFVIFIFCICIFFISFFQYFSFRFLFIFFA